MNFENTRLRIINAIEVLIEKDEYLLINNLNERTISHKLGCYLQSQFNEYEVDCEYNRNCQDDIGLAKKIYINSEKNQIVYPDIIVHKRGTNKSNLLIIECKKNNNRDYYYDREKMKHYTTTRHNNLGYKLGVNIIFSIGNSLDLIASLVWYKNGLPIKKEYIKKNGDKNKLIYEDIKVPTYKEIINKIKQKYSCTIKTCWIADAKESLGLPVKMAHNRKNLDYRENQCPGEAFKWLIDLFKEYALLEDIIEENSNYLRKY